ncbi:MAG: putative sugar nucleotidyl transferase [Sedimentisphaerales bacterium]
MRLILVDNTNDVRANFLPLALSRPLWELRCGMTSLQEKLIAKVNTNDIAYFVPDYMADAYRARVKKPVNNISVLADDDLLFVNPLLKPNSFNVPSQGRSEVGVDEQGRILYARIAKQVIKRPRLLACLCDSRRKTRQQAKARAGVDDIGKFIAEAAASLPHVKCKLKTWTYIWDLISANSEQITADFEAAARFGIEAKPEQPSVIRAGKKDVYIAADATVHPMVTIDTDKGPVYIDKGAEIQPFSRIEGPCYIGEKSILLGAKCREGNTIGPFCRVGGEVEASIFHGYSNKYHDGFIGHSYVGEWVNLGALTTTSDLKNDYSTVSVMLGGRRSINTGSPKIGSLIGDHTKTSIGTLFNTGSYVGAMAIIMATGKPLPKFIPSFAWFVDGVVTKGFGRGKLYETAKAVMRRRQCEWTTAEQAMWDVVFEMTAPVRNEAIKRGRRAMFR